MYACLGLSAVVFITHGVIRFGWETLNRRMSLDRMGLMALLNLTGAYTYAARVTSTKIDMLVCKADIFVDP